MLKTYSISDCKLIELNKIQRAEGDLTFIEGRQNIPFDIQRVYYLYDVPAGAQRGGHAHKELFQLLIAVVGSFDVQLDDGFQQHIISLNRPNEGLLITPMIWRVLSNFSFGTVCLVLASAKFDELDYYRHYNDFMAAVRS